MYFYGLGGRQTQGPPRAAHTLATPLETTPFCGGCVWFCGIHQVIFSWRCTFNACVQHMFSIRRREGLKVTYCQLKTRYYFVSRRSRARPPRGSLADSNSPVLRCCECIRKAVLRSFRRVLCLFFYLQCWFDVQLLFLSCYWISA